MSLQIATVLLRKQPRQNSNFISAQILNLYITGNSILLFIAFSYICGIFISTKGLIHIIKMYYYSLLLKDAHLFHSLSSSIKVFWRKSCL